QPQLGQVEVFIGRRPQKLYLARRRLTQLELEFGSGRIDDDLQARIGDVAVGVQVVFSVEGANDEPVFTVGGRLEIELAGVRGDGLNLLPAPPAIARYVEPNLPCPEPRQFRRIVMKGDAELELVGVNRGRGYGRGVQTADAGAPQRS